MNEPEPWLSGSRTGIPAVQRAVIHALDLAREDLYRWCGNLTDEQLNSKPADLAPITFHLRHIARSIDRLLTYAEGRPLTPTQLAELRTELDPGATRDELFRELTLALDRATARIRAFPVTSLEEPRTMGKRALPATLAGLLVHVADHTLRHVGQAITTAKVVIAHDSRSDIRL